MTRVNCKLRNKVHELLAESDVAVVRALGHLYERQTHDEQVHGETIEKNGVGFSGKDSPFLSSLALQLEVKGYLTPKQIAAARRALPKYWRQLECLVEEASRFTMDSVDWIEFKDGE